MTESLGAASALVGTSLSTLIRSSSAISMARRMAHERIENETRTTDQNVGLWHPCMTHCKADERNRDGLRCHHIWTWKETKGQMSWRMKESRRME